MMLFLVAVVYAAALVCDFCPRLQKGAKGEKILYVALMLVGLVPLVLFTLGVPVPSPAQPIQQAVKAVFRVP